MKKHFLYGLLLIFGACALILSGCSDDDDDDNNGIVNGDPNAPEIMLMDGVMGEGALTMDGQIIGVSLALINAIFEGGGAGKISADNAFEDFITFDYAYDTANYWHIFTCSIEVVDDDDFIRMVGTDSIRFTLGGYVYYPMGMPTDIDIRAHFDTDVEAEEAEVEFAQHAQMALSDLSDLNEDMEPEEMVVNGSSIDTMDVTVTEIDGIDTTICDLFVTQTQTIVDIVIDTMVTYYDNCPLGGAINISANASIGCVGEENFDITGLWTASFVFAEGGMTATYETGNTRWTFTEDCRD